VSGLIIETSDGEFWYFCQRCGDAGLSRDSEQEALDDSRLHECEN